MHIVRVNVDLVLTKKHPDGHESLVAVSGSSAVQDDEQLFVMIPQCTSSTQRTQYAVSLTYELNGLPSFATCQGINLELAIQPMTTTSQQYNTFAGSICDHDDDLLPFDDLQQQGDLFSLDFAQLQDQLWSYDQDFETRYHIQSQQETTAHSRYFHSWAFEVRSTNQDEQKLVVFRAELGYRFLQSDISMMLTEYTGEDQQHPDTAFCQEHVCIEGKNLKNREIIDSQLSFGQYRLWFFEERPQIATDCALFEFSLAMSLTNPPATIFNCNLAKFPTRLSTDRILHLRETYLLEDTQQIEFTLSEQTFMRVEFHHDYYGEAILATDDERYEIVTAQLTNGQPVQLSGTLPAGHYIFQVVVWDNHFLSSSHAAFCPLVEYEFAVVPTSQLPDLQTAACNGDEESLPPLPLHIMSPYSLPSANYMTVVKPSEHGGFVPTERILVSSTIVVNETNAPSMLQVRVPNDFVIGQIFISIVSVNDQHLEPTISESAYNFDHLSVILEAGVYDFRLIHSPLDANTFDQCAPFEFSLDLLPYEEIPCALVQGEPIPSSLDSIRFNLNEGLLHYQSSFDVPSISQGESSSDITFSTKESALFRVYVEPHDIDIDLAVFDITDSDHPQLVKSSAHEGSFHEESLVITTEPERNYVLRLSFALSNEQSCNAFNMEFALGSVMSTQEICQNNGSDMWPHNEIDDDYDSLQSQEILYFQQKQGNPRSKEIEIIRDEAFSLHCEIGYDFLLGDMALSLSKEGEDTVYFGANHLNKQTLSITDLESGTYILRLYEPVEMVRTMLGCRYFTFSVMFGEAFENGASMDDLSAPLLPPSLDRVAFLDFNGQTSFVDDYSLPGSASVLGEITTFTLASESLVRISAAQDVRESSQASSGISIYVYTLDDDVLQYEGDISHENSNANTYSTSSLHVMQPGAYYMKIVPENINHDFRQDLVLTISVGINPTAFLTEIIHDNADFQCTSNTHLTNTLNVGTESGQASLVLSDVQTTHSTLHSVQVMHEISFELTQNSHVFAQLLFDYPLDEYQLAVVLHNPQHPHLIDDEAIWGKPDDQMNVVNTLLPPGHYRLVIFQPLKFLVPGSGNDIISELQHCSVYSLEVFISPDAFDVPCTHNAIVPNDLNDRQASSAFGGPIHRGMLNFYGEDFLLHANEDGLSTYTMHASVAENSLFTLFVGLAPHRETPEIEFAIRPLSDDDEASLISATHSDIGPTYRASTFEFGQGVSDIVIGMEIRHENAEQARDQCEAFTLHMMLEPNDFVSNLLLCDPESNVDVLDDEHIDIDEVSMVGAYHFEGVIVQPVAVVGQGGDVNSRNFRFAFTLPSTEYSLSASTGFNSLVSDVNMAVFQVVGEDAQQVETHPSQLKAMGSVREDINLESILHTNNLEGDQSYYLEVQIDLVSMHLYSTNELHRTNCVPLSINIVLSPTDNSLAPPRLSAVDPSSGSFLSPRRAFVLDIVFSDDQLFVKQDDDDIVRVSSEAMQSIFSLTTSDHHKWTPLSAETQSGTTDRFWRLTFAPFEHTTIYRTDPHAEVTLMLNDDVLFAQRDNAYVGVIVAETHTYSFLVCGEHGTLSNEGLCECEQGYAHVQCDACALGYRYNALSDGFECVADPNKVCMADSCGCTNWVTLGADDDVYSLPEGQSCKVIGTCSDTSGSVQCSCPNNFAGDRCDECALGFSFWPDCAPLCDTSNCVHGECFFPAPDEYQCQCEEGWEGAACNQKVSEDLDSYQVLEIIGVVSAVIILLVTIAWFIWWRIVKARQSSSGSQSYMPVIDLEESTTTTFDDIHNTLTSSSESDLSDLLGDNTPPIISSSSSSDSSIHFSDSD